MPPGVSLISRYKPHSHQVACHGTLENLYVLTGSAVTQILANEGFVEIAPPEQSA